MHAKILSKYSEPGDLREEFIAVTSREASRLFREMVVVGAF